jgi:Uma2 family endonuclease
MIAVPNNPRISPDEYFEWEARHEYINGEVFAMAGGTMKPITEAVSLRVIVN